MDQPSKTFQIKYVVHSGISCINETVQTVTINKSPVVQFGTIPGTCLGLPGFSFTQAKELTSVPGSGIFTGDGTTGNGYFSPNSAGAGPHIIKYSFTSTQGCSDTAIQTIQVYPQPFVDAGKEKTLIKGAFVILKPTASGDQLSYLWTPDQYIDNDTTLNPRVSPPSDMTYTLTATSAEGCSNTSSVLVKVLNGLYIPTGFTPNGDGLNDVWRLPVLDAYPNTEAWVYDRWGKVVYHSVGPVVSWDGMFNGIKQPTGTYVYLIDLKNGTPLLKGTLTLIR